MKRFIKYPSISQFKDIVKNVIHSARFFSHDPITDITVLNMNATLPVIKAVATEKIHGTNASVSYSDEDGFWVQSRNNIITVDKDNAGCAFAAMNNKDAWMDIIRALASFNKIDLEKHIITVYFEWCGGNIQKKSAVSGLEKLAIIFPHFRVSPVNPELEDAAYWLETKSYNSAPANGIRNILEFPCYNVEIDFNKPEIAQNYLVKLVEETIEPNSPVGKAFGIDGNIGEGVVVTFWYKDTLHTFKVKGDRHANSKVKKLEPVDSERLQKVQDVAQKTVPSWRLEQMFAEANDTLNGGEPTIKNIGTFIKLLKNDILKEEIDLIAESGFEPKEVFNVTSKIATNWYKEYLGKF